MVFMCHDFTSSFLSLRLTDGELYAGVYIDFMGTDSAIFRTLGKQTAMRTDQYNSRWLNGNVSTCSLFCTQHYFPSCHSLMSVQIFLNLSLSSFRALVLMSGESSTHATSSLPSISSISLLGSSRNEIVDLSSLLHMTQ